MSFQTVLGVQLDASIAYGPGNSLECLRSSLDNGSVLTLASYIMPIARLTGTDHPGTLKKGGRPPESDHANAG